MNETLKLALSKLPVKADRTAIAVGTHTIDTTVRVQGTIKVGEDYESTPTVSIPLKATICHLFRVMGVTRDIAAKHLYDAMKAALEDEEDAEKLLQESTVDFDGMSKKLEKEVLQKLPKMQKKGPVTAKLTVEEV